MNDPFEVVSAQIDEDQLNLMISYGGGCEEHTFSSCFGSFMESFPVQVNLEITHNGNQDACLALITQPLQIDLTPLKEAYQASYQSDGGVIILHVPNFDQSIEYSF